MAASWFVHRHAHRAERIDELPPVSEVCLRRPPLAAPPAPFRMSTWKLKPPVPPPKANVQAAPMRLHHYVGRVEEWPSPRTPEVTVTLWEWPSGRELLAGLSVKKHLDGRRPQEGSFLRVWTWLELPGRGRRVPRIHVEVEEPKS
jgi:hypothetical protein